MTEHGQNLTLTDIAKLTEVGVSAVSNWRKRHTDFPRSALVSGQELFSADEIAHWLSERKIARNGLHPGEGLGTTYGDRFVRNSGAPTPNVPSEPSHLHSEVSSDWANQLWQIVDLLRSDLEPVSAIDFIMAMLYIRATSQELWHAITQQRSWDAVNKMMRDVPPFSEHGVPLLATVAPGLSSDQFAEAIRRFDEIDLDSAGSAAMFDALLENVNRDLGRRGGHFTPSSVVRCLVDILDLPGPGTVYDPSCGSGELLAAAAQDGVGPVFGQAMNGRSLRMTLLNLSMHGRAAELQIGGPEIRHGAFTDEQFDVVLSNPPFTMALSDNVERDAWPFGVPTKRTASLAWLQIAVRKLKAGGRAAILMPNGTLSTGAGAEIRRRMIDAGVVEGIAALPDKLFADTEISVALWLIRRPEPGEAVLPEVFFIDATSMGAMNERGQRILHEAEIVEIVQEYHDWRDAGRSGNSRWSAEFVRSVSIEEIRRNDYDLQPRRYVGLGSGSRGSTADTTSAKIRSFQQELDELDEHTKVTRRTIDIRLETLHDLTAEEWRQVSLDEICRIQTGPGAIERERGLTIQGWTPLVLPRNIMRGHISHEGLDTVSPEISAKFQNYELQPGDIVCARSGTLGRHGLVREAELGWLLGPSCMRLQPDNTKVFPEYLVHYLNSPVAQTWIASESRGATAIPHISSTTMRELVIPLPPVPVQLDIVATMNSINVHIEQHKQAASTMQSLRDLIFPALTPS